MQVPSNMIINKIARPSWYIAGAVSRIHALIELPLTSADAPMGSDFDLFRCRQQFRWNGGNVSFFS